jgi:aldehyde:ferredoxin oxidoreductase
MIPAASIHRPRVLRVHLDRLAASGGREGARLEPWSDPDPRVELVGLASGSALGHALFHRATVERRDAAPLVLTVGAAVRAALPTAARTSVLSRSPLTGLPSEGQVGGAFARSLARVADALVLEGASGRRGAVLVVHADAHVELVVDESLAGASPMDVRRALSARFGPCAALAIGAAGEAGLPFASIAALEDPPSFVGRGGLGSVFAGLGLKAIVVLAPPVEPDPARVELDRELQRALARSPRLKARSAGGTLELAASFAARDGTAGEEHAFLALAESSTAKKGCDGCPTPCGLVFERGHPRGATRHLGRFGALRALSDRLGLDVEDARALLERCDELALDAKEAGNVLALAAATQRETPLTRASALRLLDDVVARRGLGATLALGAHAAARALGIDPPAARANDFESTAPNFAVRLGAAVSVRGSDPMRTFPFLAVDAASRERLVAAMVGVPLPRGAEIAEEKTAKGRIVWWHENLVSALDATGFCAFSAAGLLSDGVATLDEVARLIGSSAIATSPRPGRALLALGASIALLQRATAAHCTSAVRHAVDPELDHPALLGEYARLRGLDRAGRPTVRALALIGNERILDSVLELEDAPDESAPDARPALSGPGRITFGASGPLRRALDTQAALERDFPATVRECVDEIARRVPKAAGWLVLDGRMVPQVWCDGRRLEPLDWVSDGDHIELVIAVGGG